MLKHQFLTGKELVSVTLLGIIGTVSWAIFLGQDFGPDMINYHFYSGFLAFHKEKLAINVFPASMQGYLNPYIYGLIYWLYHVLPPIGVGIILASLHGICFISAYVIARMLLEHWQIK